MSILTRIQTLAQRPWSKAIMFRSYNNVSAKPMSDYYRILGIYGDPAIVSDPQKIAELSEKLKTMKNLEEVHHCQIIDFREQQDKNAGHFVKLIFKSAGPHVPSYYYRLSVVGVAPIDEIPNGKISNGGISNDYCHLAEVLEYLYFDYFQYRYYSGRSGNTYHWWDGSDLEEIRSVIANDSEVVQKTLNKIEHWKKTASEIELSHYNYHIGNREFLMDEPIRPPLIM